MTKQRKNFEWVAPKYVKPQRGLLWYALVFLFAAGVIFYGIKSKDIFFVAAILLVIGLLLMHDFTHDELTEFSLDERGLTIGTVLIPYKNIAGFNIPDHFPKTLLFETNLKLRPFIEINIESNDEEKITEILSAHIQHRPNLKEDPAGRLIRLLKL